MWAQLRHLYPLTWSDLWSDHKDPCPAFQTPERFVPFKKKNSKYLNLTKFCSLVSASWWAPTWTPMKKRYFRVLMQHINTQQQDVVHYERISLEPKMYFFLDVLHPLWFMDLQGRLFFGLEILTPGHFPKIALSNYIEQRVTGRAALQDATILNVHNCRRDGQFKKYISKSLWGSVSQCNMNKRVESANQESVLRSRFNISRVPFSYLAWLNLTFAIMLSGNATVDINSISQSRFGLGVSACT